MERFGEVTAVDGQWLEITFCRPSDCEKCGACHGQAKTTTLRLKGEAQPGDKVLVSMPESMLTKATMLAYALPLAGLLVGMFVGSLIPLPHSLGPIIGGVAGVAIPAVSLRLTEGKRSNSQDWQPRIISVIPARSEE